MKQAYLIMAHNNFEYLKRLIEYITNDERSVVFLHVDKKAERAVLGKCLGESLLKRINLVPSIDVTWGGFSQIACELQLLTAAVEAKEEYLYYHLLSGADLPVKDMKVINDFFELHAGKEFLYYDINNNSEMARERCKEFHVLQEIVGRNRQGAISWLEDKLLSLQRHIGIDRTARIAPYLGKGANWFSITDGFAKEVVKQKPFIYRYFKYTKCADEVFLHTVLNKTQYRCNLISAKELAPGVQYTNMVYTDWNRGNPYVFQAEDVPALVASPYLFARKARDSDLFGIVKEMVK